MAKVMLVEDDNNLREIYSARLQAEGYDIVTAKDGEEALVVAKAEKPELVISDVMMPKISGFEMLDILRNTDGMQDVKVIMLTALGQSDDQQRANKLGANRYLVKSQVTLEDIIKAAHDLLEGEDESVMPEGVLPADAAAVPQTAPEPATAVTAAPAAEPVAVAPAPLATPPAETEPVSVAEPVAVAPVQAEPTPVTPAPEPVATPPASTLNSAIAEPANQEQAEVDAKIEDFIAGASSDPVGATAPLEIATPSVAAAPSSDLSVEGASGVTSEATPPTPAASVFEPAPAPTDAASADDQLMENAVNQLMASTPGSGVSEPAPQVASPVASQPAPAPEAASPEPTTQPVAPVPVATPQSPSAPATATPPVEAPAPIVPPAGGNPFAPQEVPSTYGAAAAPAGGTVTPTVTTPAPAPTPVAPQDDDPAAGQVPVAHKKVIQPLDTEPKPDIASLVALEEAKEAAAAPPPGPVATIASATHEPLQAPLGQAPAVAPAAPGSVAAPGQSPFVAPGSGEQPLDPNSIAL